MGLEKVIIDLICGCVVMVFWIIVAAAIFDIKGTLIKILKELEKNGNRSTV